ncbi:LuxR family transcriptional regulator [Candidatus Regiella endosymbiont of Tuberolachnus salignus]|uniref:helix-turn-helix transcriptional regulator n=1 Tax=Candidatus Regiella endosymbiont of Tuberolachnus salignus TaxID=3077956 RepID=UPI0030CB59DC
MLFDNETINNLIKDDLDKEFESYGDIKYAYAIMNKKNTTEMSVISNRPDWFKIYIRDRYQHIDPVIITALNRITSFPWDENIMINSDLKLPKIFNIVSSYNITNGYTFVVHDNKNNLALLSIMIDKSYINDINDINKLIEYNKDKLQSLLITVHDKTMSLYRNMGIKYHRKKETEEIFSRRENEILYWSSVGKTYQEIAIILGIRPCTVKFHMANIVKKLGVMNGKHAIRLGIELKLIRPVFSTKEKIEANY